MYNIYLLENFNNYYNRRIIRYETIKEYWTHQTNNKRAYINFKANFIPNDGVSTEHIVNAQQLDIKWNPDYLILVDEYEKIVQRWFVIDSVRTTMGQYRLSLKRDTVADYFNETISAPCFIEKATIPYNNPLIYNKENFSVNQIKTSEHFLKDPTDSAWIVGYLSNNFKTEDVFKDGIDGIDIVDNEGYKTIKNVRGTNIASEVPEGYTYTADIKNSIKNYYNIQDDVDPFDCVGYNPKKFLRAISDSNIEGNIGYVRRDDIFYTFYTEASTTGFNKNSYAFCFDGNGDATQVGLIDDFGEPTKIVDGLYKGKILDLGWQIKDDKAVEFIDILRGKMNPITPVYNYSSFNAKLPNMISEIMNINGITNFVNFAGGITGISKKELEKTLKLYDSKNRTLYRIRLREKIKSLQTVYGSNTIGGIVQINTTGGNIVDTVYSKYQETYFDKYANKWPEPKSGALRVLIKIPVYYLEISTEFVKPVYGYDFPDTVNTLSDNPYKMFCIPYNSVTLGGYETWGNGVKTDPNICFETAIDLSRRLTGSNYLSDLQILPYCPCLEYFNESDKYFDVGEDSNLGKNVQYSFIYEGYVEGAEIKLKNDIDEGAQPIGIILFPEKSSTSFTVNAPSEITTFNLINEFEDNPIEAKVKNQCDLYRLCSPNYASAFDFNVVKNKGVDFFRINMTFKPYNPFIQIVPNFKELYGSDFNDNRGLILGGDFSLPQINDAWETYQLNNKTYEASFNRTIENMEKTHKYDMIGNVAGATGGVAAGAATGALIGTAIAPGVGTAIGAVAGGVVSAIGGAADLALSQYRFNETRDLAKDQFGFALQNIQALSQTLSRTSSLTINHKLFPFLEYYTCTDEEKEALRNKIKWNGMTIGVISNNGIQDYILDDESYIKGSIINIEIPDDAHIAQDISREIYEGVRLKNEYSI